MPTAMTCQRVLPALLWLQSPIDPDEQVILFPTLGRPAEHGQAWAIDVHGWIFEDVPTDASLRAWEDLLDLDEEITDPAQRRLLRQRLKHWLVDNERGQRIEIAIGNRRFRTEPSGANGHFHYLAILPARDLPPAEPVGGQAQRLTVRAVTRPGDRRLFEGHVYLVPERGLSIISDIDDTLRITEVRDRKAMLRNTFLRPFQPVAGMAALFTKWRNEHDAQFHYVSASPYQLYGPLSEFIRSAGFPEGTFHLKAVRVKDRTLSSLFTPGDEYKRERVQPLLKKFPDRAFICVGDSGELDPEAYGDLARAHPGQIRRILIRDVTGQGPDDPRYRHAFRGLPPANWRIFTEPRDIADLSDLVTIRPASQPSPATRPGR